jgi:hypothetical protein
MDASQVPAQSTDVSPSAPHPLVRYWWVFPSVLAVGIVVTAALNREQPLTEADIEPAVQAAIRGNSKPHPATADFTAVRLVSKATVTTPLEGTADFVVKTRVERLGLPAVFRRSDDWYEPQGQRALTEERVLNWKGLLSLRHNVRNPAALYHDVFANQGWREQVTQSLTFNHDADFPLRTGSELRATALRMKKAQPGSGSESTLVQRAILCKSEGRFKPREILAAWVEELPRIVCTHEETTAASSGTREPMAKPPRHSSSEYAYWPSHDVFIAVSWTEDEPTPFQEAGEPTPQRRGRFAYTSIEAIPARQR